MAEHKYANWYDEQKTIDNLFAVLFGDLYVEHNGRLYECLDAKSKYRRIDKMHIHLSDINNGDPLFTSWYEILYSPAFSIMRKEAEDD